METKDVHSADGLRVVVYNLDHEALPYHFHSEISDVAYCARGQLSIQFAETGESFAIGPGQVFQIPNRTKHRSVNSAPAGTLTRFVLLQIGTFDIHFIAGAKEIAAQFAGRIATPVADAVIYIQDRKDDILELAARFERQKPELLTAEEQGDVVKALQFIASHGLQGVSRQVKKEEVA